MPGLISSLEAWDRLRGKDEARRQDGEYTKQHDEETGGVIGKHKQELKVPTVRKEHKLH